ncbi:hypothetical protein E2C01_006484 [Portunus trituberculatus]|uniref:Uncharacterized protein n=1 Tax=Portunus trituberculatus TaxID=210409 RepID=A0A5B7CWG8_PORTR|nr:hypothetical protein [Portunus trituberculatus]
MLLPRPSFHMPVFRVGRHERTASRPTSFPFIFSLPPPSLTPSLGYNGARPNNSQQSGIIIRFPFRKCDPVRLTWRCLHVALSFPLPTLPLTMLHLILRSPSPLVPLLPCVSIAPLSASPFSPSARLVPRQDPKTSFR